MKIKQSDYLILKGAIMAVDKQKIKDHKEFLITENKFTDFNKRLRWDCFHATGLRIGDGVGVDGDINLYSYLNDNHIDTALNKIMIELNLY